MWGWANDIPRAIVAAFQKHYPRVRFEFVDLSQAATHRKLQLSLYSGSAAPDLAMVSDPLGPRFWDLGLLDLTAGMQPYRQQFPTGKMEHVARPDGSLQGVPWDAGPTTLVYRRDVLRRYRIEPESFDTWEHVIDAGRKLTRDSGGRVAILQSNVATNPNGLPRCTMIGQFEVFAQQNGGSWFAPDGSVALASNANADALELTRRLRTTGVTRNDLGSAQAEYAAMAEGAVACYIAPIWTRQQMLANAPDTAGHWGAVRLPAVRPAGRRAVDLMGSSMVITEQCSEPVAAWEFLRFWLLSPEGRIASYREGGLFENIYLPAARRPFFRRPDPFFDGDRWLRLNSEVAREAPSFRLGIGFDAVKRQIEARLPAFVSGDLDARTLLRQVDEAVRR